MVLVNEVPHRIFVISAHHGLQGEGVHLRLATGRLVLKQVSLILRCGRGDPSFKLPFLGNPFAPKGNRGARTRTSQFYAMCIACYRSVHYPRVTSLFELPRIGLRGVIEGSVIIAEPGVSKLSVCFQGHAGTHEPFVLLPDCLGCEFLTPGGRDLPTFEH